MNTTLSPIEVGVFEFERSTKNTHVYTRDVGGRKESQYVRKELLGSVVPTKVRVVLEFDS